MSTPAWVQDALFYQIFPDRFCNGDASNDPPVVLPWDACTTPRGFHGGDLAGITQSLDYLTDLGVTALLLTPIFLSPSNHRYDTLDYYRIDPKLGTLDDFHRLAEGLHRRNMRLILDGVFNHTARGFFAFNDIIENGADSPYLDWYHVRRLPLDAYGHGEPKNYLGWHNHKSLPKLNIENPRVRQYIMGVVRYWLEQGADGWRLDAPDQIENPLFWAEVRATARQVKPDAYLLGEIWQALPMWVDENHFDALMNYPVRAALIGLLNGNWRIEQFREVIAGLLAAYPWETNLAMYVHLSSHDTERIMTALHEDERKVRLAMLFQFAFPGAPAIYYGDEIGLTGGADPYNRGGFPWDQRYWNQGLRTWVQKLAALRQANAPLRGGDFCPLPSLEDTPVVAFARSLDDEGVIAVLNASDQPCTVRLDASTLGWLPQDCLDDLLGDAAARVHGHEIQCDLAAWSGAWFARPR